MKDYTTEAKHIREPSLPVDAHLARYDEPGRRLYLHPLKADILRMFALVAMVIDHGAKAFGPANPPYWATTIGTAAFPIFIAVSGILAAQSRGKGWRRLLTIGVVAIGTEPIFDMLLDPYFLLSSGRTGTNILFAFLALAAAIRIVECADWSRRFHMIAAPGAIYFIFYVAATPLAVGAFGIFGLLAGLGFYLSARHSVIWLPLALLPLFGFSSDPYALFGYWAAGLVVTYVSLPEKKAKATVCRRYLWKHFFLMSYSAHLAFLLLLKLFA